VLDRRTSARFLAALATVALLAGCNSAGTTVDNGGAAAIPPAGNSDLEWVAAATASEECYTDAGDDELARQVLSLVNIERARVGAAPLTLDDELTQAAEDYACTMAGEDFFDHYHPDTGQGPGDRAAEANYDFFAVGENLAGGQTTAAEAVKDWMNSPGHRENMLSADWQDTGIGLRRGAGELRIYWVQLFGLPADDAHAGFDAASVFNDTDVRQYDPSAES